MASDLYKWVHGIHEGFQVIGCMLLQEPYNGVVVEFGEVQLCEEGVEFSWRLIETPEDCDELLTQENTHFAKYLERIVFDRLSEIDGALAHGENQNQTDDDSGTG